jgi:hypothetical protein
VQVPDGKTRKRKSTGYVDDVRSAHDRFPIMQKATPATVRGHIDKFMRTDRGGGAKPPPVPKKKLSKETSNNIFNKKKAYTTPRGVYDRTTCHKLVH